MRLQLIVAVLALATGALAAGARVAAAQTAFSSKVQLYVDDDHTTVVSPIVSAQADIDGNTNVSAGYTADVITSASIDVVSQASARTIHDTRHQANLGVSHVFGDLTAHAGYTFSVENDYLSNVLTGSFDQTLFDKNSTLSIGYALSLNTVGRAGDENFARSLDVHDLSASWTQVLNRRAVAQATYDVSYSDGYQASPYRYVPIRATVDADAMYWVPESDPTTRWRHALVVGANYFLPRDSALQGDYRFYRDTWGITSSTVGARYIVALGKRAELRLRERFYVQSGASFYRDHYATPDTYMALDRELSPLWSETFGGKLSYDLTARVQGELKLDAFYFHYDDFPLLPHRIGANVGVGVSLDY